MKPLDLSLYLVLDPVLCQRHSMVETARLAVAGGATVVQLRDKTADTEAMVATGRALMSALKGTGVPLIINDDVAAMLAIDADGLHVGQDDMPVSEARARIGAEKLLGISVESEAALAGADPEIVDYAGIGPVFATPTKPDHKQPIGFDGLARLVAHCPVPTVAIGGLKAEHVGSALASGTDGIAVVSAICGQDDPQEAARLLSAAIAKVRSERD